MSSIYTQPAPVAFLQFFNNIDLVSALNPYSLSVI